MAAYRERYFLSTDNTRLYYRDYGEPRGDALCVICLPGLTRSSMDFEGLALHLKDRYRVLSPDFRGRGKSGYAADPASYVPIQYARDTGILMADAGVHRAVIVGTSLGGIVAMLMAGIMRARLAGVVLNDIGPVIEPEGVARIRGYVGKMGDIPSFEAAAAAIKATAATQLPHYSDADWLAMAHRTFVERDGRIVANYDPNIAIPFAGETAAPPDLWPFFEALVGLPTLSIRGEKSDLFSQATQAEMKRRHPAMEVLTLQGIGHAPDLVEPEALAAIDALLARVPRRRGLIAEVGARIAAVRHMGRIMRQVQPS